MTFVLEPGTDLAKNRRFGAKKIFLFPSVPSAVPSVRGHESRCLSEIILNGPDSCTK